MGDGGDRNNDLDPGAVAGAVEPDLTEAWIAEPTPPEVDAPEAVVADPRPYTPDASDADLISEPRAFAGEVVPPAATAPAIPGDTVVGADLRDRDDLDDLDGPAPLVDEPIFEFDDFGGDQPLWVDPFPDDVDDSDASDDDADDFGDIANL